MLVPESAPSFPASSGATQPIPHLLPLSTTILIPPLGPMSLALLPLLPLSGTVVRAQVRLVYDLPLRPDQPAGHGTRPPPLSHHLTCLYHSLVLHTSTTLLYVTSYRQNYHQFFPLDGMPHLRCGSILEEGRENIAPLLQPLKIAKMI